MEFHAAANIFPMDDENIDSLAKDIESHGLQCPIEILDGKIIDGRRRFMATKIAGVDPEFVTVSPDDPVAYVLSLNLHRRHLNTSQLAMVSGRARAMYDAAAKERMLAGKKLDPPVNLPEGTSDSRDAAGKAVGVSGRTVDFATKVLNHAEPEIIKAVDSGRMSVSSAAVYATEDAETQRRIASDPKRNRKYGAGVGGSESIRDEPESTEEPCPGKSRGKGVQFANEAIDCLKRIPKNDALRKRGFQIVTDWIKHNK